MKILMTIPYFVPAWGYGGPVKACYLLGKKLVQQGHQVTVLSTDSLDSKHRIPIRQEIIEGIEVVRFPNVSNRLAKRVNGFTPIGMGNWLKKHLQGFDAVHCHEFFFFPNILAAKWARHYGVPFFVQPHGSAVPKPERGRALIKKGFNLFWGKKILRQAKAVIAVTDAEADDLREYLPGIRVVILPNGIEMSPPRHAGEWPYGRFGIAEDTPVIVSLGRLHPVKGFDLLLESFVHLQRMMPEAYLCIVGPDEGSLADLEARAAAAGVRKRVVFTGLVVGEEKDRLLASASLFALFSRDEPFPIAVLEAVAGGLPVAVSRHIGIASQVKEMGAGEVIDPEASREAAVAMREMLRPEVAARYRKNLPRLLELFDMGRIARAAVSLYSR